MWLIEKLKGTFEIDHTGHTTLYAMEGLRGLAVFLVFLVHYVTASEKWIKDTDDLFYFATLVRSLGNIGVDLFFVLSGYLIYGTLIRKPQRFIPYLRRRIERIYPVFAVVFSLYLAISILIPEFSRIPLGTLDAVHFVAANFLLLPGMLQIEPIITVAWSLSYEFFFYLVIPLLIFLLRLRAWRPSWRIVFFVLLAFAILAFPAFFGGHVRLAMFLSGMVVIEVETYYRSEQFANLLGILGLVIALTVTVLQKTYAFNGQWKFAALAVCFFYLCSACFASDGVVGRAFRWTPMRWLGNISYSYYLVHGLVVTACFMWMKSYIVPSGLDVAVFWLGLIGVFFATVIVSTALFMVVEKPLSLQPAKKRARRISGR